jgi:hypothetical protein
MCQAFLTGIPIVVVVREIPEAFYLVLTFLIFVLCMVILLLIFLPKIFMHRTYAGMSEAEQSRVLASSIRKSAMRKGALGDSSGLSDPAAAGSGGELFDKGKKRLTASQEAAMKHEKNSTDLRDESVDDISGFFVAAGFSRALFDKRETSLAVLHEAAMEQEKSSPDPRDGSVVDAVISPVSKNNKEYCC